MRSAKWTLVASVFMPSAVDGTVATTVPTDGCPQERPLLSAIGRRRQAVGARPAVGVRKAPSRLVVCRQLLLPCTVGLCLQTTTTTTTTTTATTTTISLLTLVDVFVRSGEPGTFCRK